MPDAPRPKQASTGPGANARWIVGGVLLVLAVIFILENRDPVGIRLLIPLVIMPQWAALTLTLVIGFIVGMLVSRRRK
ncbi:DUF1049 domain-containing protein [Actinomycetospora flava]|uniref:DUF1049 domain-containing protein n=1 Tax=Actinomycetospora flava TaxID=3129232 RepID=A0ABU8MDJ4_9PSEU